MKKLISFISAMILFIAMAFVTNAAETVYYENDFSDPTTISDFTANRGKWEIKDGKLYLSELDDGSTFSFIIFTADDDVRSLSDYTVEADFYNVQTAAGIVSYSDISLVNDESDNSFYGYLSFISNDAKKPAFGYGADNGNWGGNLMVGENCLMPYGNYHITANHSGNTVEISFTDMNNGEVLYKYAAETTEWNSGSFGFRLRGENDGISNINTLAIDNLKVTLNESTVVESGKYLSAAEANAAEGAVRAKLNKFVCYGRFNLNDAPSSDDNDGLTPETPKRSLGYPDGSGVCNLLAANNGGTFVTNGKLLIGAKYTFEGIEDGVIRITANDGMVSYKNPIPEENPKSGAMKFGANKSLTFKNDAIIEDIILFNEIDMYSPTISITNGCTLIMGDNIDSMKKDTNTFPTHISLYVEEGSILIVKSGIYNTITGEGKVYIADGVQIENIEFVEIDVDENGMIIPDFVVTMPIIVTTMPEPVETTPAPETELVFPVTTEPEETTIEAEETTNAPDDETTIEAEETTDAPNEETTAETEEITDDDDEEDEEDEEDEKKSSKEDSSDNTVIIVAIIAGAAVIIAASISAAIIASAKKKK